MERPGALLPQRRRHQEQQQGTPPGGCSALGMVTQRAGKRRQMFSSLPLRTSELSSFGSRVWLGNKVSSSREPLIRQEAVPSGPRVGEREREDSARRPWGCNAAAAIQGPHAAVQGSTVIPERPQREPCLAHTWVPRPLGLCDNAFTSLPVSRCMVRVLTALGKERWMRQVDCPSTPHMESTESMHVCDRTPHPRKVSAVCTGMDPKPAGGQPLQGEAGAWQ